MIDINKNDPDSYEATYHTRPSGDNRLIISFNKKVIGDLGINESNSNHVELWLIAIAEINKALKKRFPL